MACLSSKTLHFLSTPTPNTKLSKNHHANLHFSPNPNHASIHFSSNTKRTTVQIRVQARLETKANKSNSSNQLLLVADTSADRAEMHAIIGQQRNNWNHLLLYSINSMHLFASLMAGLSTLTITPQNSHIQLAFKISSTLLFSFATLMMIIVNWIQPSQLAEEQRNASRLFKQLERSVRTCVSVGSVEKNDINEAIERVLALDHAYPLSLLPRMLEKFPKKVRPAMWWPQFDPEHKRARIDNIKKNGWNKELEAEMKNILKTMKKKDEEQYLSCGEIAMKINRALAITGPIFAGLAAIGSSLIGFSNFGHLPIILSLTCGSLSVIINSLEHGGQIGMVFELFRNCAGFYKEMEEEIEANLRERNYEKRESGELLETKMALRLGRSIADLKNFGLNGEDENGEFAGKLL